MLCGFAKYHSSEKIKKNEMCGVRCIYRESRGA